jgi:hypothetical protein
MEDGRTIESVNDDFRLISACTRDDAWWVCLLMNVLALGCAYACREPWYGFVSHVFTIEWFARFSPFHFFSCFPMSSSHWNFVFASGGKYVFLVSQIFLGVQAMEINGI